MKFDFDLIRNLEDKKLRAERIAEFLSKCTPDDPPLLSDLLVEAGRYGGAVLRAIAAREKANATYNHESLFRFKIQAIKDEYGKPYKPGDYVEYKTRKPSTLKDNPTDVDNAKRVGNFVEKYMDVHKYEVAEDGSITCGFEVAGYFLMNYGRHAVTNVPLTRKVEMSKNVSKEIKNGKTTFRHIWYWRFREMEGAPTAKEGAVN